jgi:transcriptional regulator with XRE-family HTH domain
MGKSRELRGLAAARRALKMDQKTVAMKAGLDPSRVSRYESGDRRMGREAAEALAPVLKSEPRTIMFENRTAMVERAMENRDPEAVLKAATSAVKITGDEDLSPEGEEALDDLVETALKFVEFMGAPVGDDDEEVYGVEEGRDPLGHRVSKKAAAESRQESPIWSSRGGVADSPEPLPEEYDEPGMDGRNYEGHRVVPFEDLEAEPFEDEEEGW